jgi:hypothetical protein
MKGQRARQAGINNTGGASSAPVRAGMDRSKPWSNSSLGWKQNKSRAKLAPALMLLEALLDAQERSPAGHRHASKQQAHSMLAAGLIVIPTIERPSLHVKNLRASYLPCQFSEAPQKIIL